MRTIIFFLFFLCAPINTKAQVYTFDYYTLYEYTKSENSKEKSFELTYSNSKNFDYHLIVLVNSGKVNSNHLIDYSRKISYLFEPVDSIANIPKTALRYEKSLPFNIKTQKNNVYDILQKSDTIKITRYRNTKKKKIINECIVTTIPTEITKNSRYNFFPFRNPLLIERFEYDNPDLVQYSYFIENEKKVHFRKLLEIMQTNFKITIPNQDNTKH